MSDETITRREFEQAINLMKRSYQQIVEVAEAHRIVANIEPHGHFTTKPEFMDRMLKFCDSPYLRLNLDTGNTFIAGQYPVAFLGQFIARLNHVHVKDVSSSLAAATRGKQTVEHPGYRITMEVLAMNTSFKFHPF